MNQPVKMRKKSILRRSALGNLIVFFLIFIVHACDLISPSLTPMSNKKLLPKQQVIVVFNGLWQPIKDLSTPIQKLKAACQKHNLNISIATLEESNTAEIAIDQQAVNAFNKLKERYAGGNYEIIFFGHSQGGLRAAKILELNKQEKILDIKGLVTTATPWEGAPAAAITKQTVNTYFSKRTTSFLLHGVQYFYPASGQLKNQVAINNFFDQNFPTHKPGVQDLVPGSPLLANIAGSLSENQLPILSIAGSNGDIKSLLLTSGLPTQYNFSPYYIRMFPWNATYRHVFAGGLRREHDLVVPLHSQLALNIPKSHTFSTHIVPDAVHDALPGLNITADQVIYNHPVCIAQIISFAKKHFKLS